MKELVFTFDSIQILECKNLSKSVESVAESFFIEILLEKKKKLIIGVIYRHHQSITYFVDNFLADILHKIGQSKKTCAIMGDFNVDLLKIDNHDESNLFYNVLTANGFRPLVLQPTRVIKSSATLIDNIFLNDCVVKSKGGNVVSSISDHFAQFSCLDLFPKVRKEELPKFGRSYKSFSDAIFEKELDQINWDILLEGKDADSRIQLILTKTTEILDKLAPIRKLTKREANLSQVPWLTRGILKSMNSHDNLHKNIQRKKAPRKE